MKEYKKEKNIWRKMLSRCQDHFFPSYDIYGGKGVKVCPQWQDFNVFMEDMGPCPSECNAIIRLDESIDFLKINCKWGLVKAGRPRRQITKKVKRKIMKNPHVVTMKMEKEYIEFLKNQAIHKSLENKRVFTVTDLIKEALNLYCPAPKQLDMFNEE